MSKKEFDTDATYGGQREIADAIRGISASMATDITLSVSGKAADAKATGDAIGSLAADGNYVKKSDTKNVCENIGILDTRMKTNSDAIELKANSADVYNKTTIDGLISDDGTTKTLFGMIVTIDAETGAVTLSEPEPEPEPEPEG